MYRKRVKLYHGQEMMIDRNELYLIEGLKSYKVATLEAYDETLLRKKDVDARQHYSSCYEQFVLNTIDFAKRERHWFQSKPELPKSLDQLRGEQVFIVARNTDYEKDIEALRPILKKKEIIVIAVDGAADGLLKHQIKPNFITGDMDSISKNALFCGATIICHQHPSGRSPGKERVDELGLDAESIRFVGTSEDVAIMASYWSEASRIFLIGCRIGMEEFLEKGRHGMGATWLARVQAGEKITDLKGIHHVASNSLLNVGLSEKAERSKILDYVRSFFQERFYAWKKKEVL